MTYEELASSPDAEGVDIIDYKFESERIKGLYCDGTVAINKQIPTSAEKSCILSEELGHYHTSAGDIIDMSSSTNRKQELRARAWAYDRMVGLNGIVECYCSGCQSISEMAEHLNTTEDFLIDALSYYRHKYGGYKCVSGNYVIYFEPYITVVELI